MFTKNRSSKTANGFTMIELVIVILVIGVLASIVITNFSNAKIKADDNKRAADAKIIAEALEKYYDKHGEYPVCSGVMDQPSSTVASSTLIGLDPEVLTTPSMASGLNSIVCQNMTGNGSDDSFSYVMPGTRFVIKYRQFMDGTIGVIYSRHGAPPITATSITTGWLNTCAVSTTFKAYCWGNNDHGQLGNNSTSSFASPTLIYNFGVTIKAINSNLSHTCAIGSDNKAYCWGSNNFGDLGDGTTNQSNVPVPVSTTGLLYGLSIKYIAAGREHSCVIASDNNGYCWGLNESGQLGDGTTNNSTVPVAVNMSGALSGKTLLTITAGSDHTCAIASDYFAYCWGKNNYGQIGDDTTTTRLEPTKVKMTGGLNGTNFKSVSTSGNTGCAIGSDGNGYCWGLGSSGELGNGILNSSHPIPVSRGGALNGLTLKLISSGIGSTCAIASDYKAYCWGNNDTYQLGDNTNVSKSAPVAVYSSGALNGKTLIGISVGSGHVCALAEDSNSNLYCWGSDQYGQIGDGQFNTNIPTPTATGEML